MRDAAKLRKHYFTTKGWRLDFLSVLPTDFAYFWWMPGKCYIQVPCPVIVRLNRLFRLPRMLEWFERTETATGYPNAFRICKVSWDFCWLLLLWFFCFSFIETKIKSVSLVQCICNYICSDTHTHINKQTHTNWYRLKFIRFICLLFFILIFPGCFSNFSFNPLECLFVLCDKLLAWFRLR